MRIDAVHQVALAPTAAGPSIDDGRKCCSATRGHDFPRWRPRALAAATPAGVGVLGSALILALYFVILTLVSGWQFTIEQFVEWRPFVLALAIGFGVQIALFVYLRSASHAVGAGKVVTTTGAASAVAMVSCCTHYLVNLLPALGATGLVGFVGQYQAELFWFGIASNLAGVAYLGSRVLASDRRSLTT
jgi:Cu+-exporting ATPase